MPTIEPESGIVTHINVFTVPRDKQDELTPAWARWRRGNTKWSTRSALLERGGRGRIVNPFHLTRWTKESPDAKP